ncbi:unnamed protein product [Sphenostylis stenocarpa]|uniref:Uncharacterized protein n=1 Tax=Sphenostylis stenocarpa TaxID=92480 RepID=A0AA86SYH4_9FABA|nr:unnamed protein product [Sphenostylis stenocarpa]
MTYLRAKYEELQKGKAELIEQIKVMVPGVDVLELDSFKSVVDGKRSFGQKDLASSNHCLGLLNIALLVVFTCSCVYGCSTNVNIY